MKRAKFKYYFLQVLNLIFSFFLASILVEFLGINDKLSEAWTYSMAYTILLSILFSIGIGKLITSKLFSRSKMDGKDDSFKVNGPRFFARVLETLAYVMLTKYMLGFIIQIINPDLRFNIGIDALEIVGFLILIILTIPQTLLANWARKKVAYLPKNDQESRGQAKLLLLAIQVHLIFVSISLARDIVSDVRSLNEVEGLKHWIGWSIVLSIGSIWLSNIEINRIFEEKRKAQREKEVKNTLKNLKRSLGIQETKTKKEETKHQDLIDGIKHELRNHLSYSLLDFDNLKHEINDDPEKYEPIIPIIKRIEDSVRKANNTVRILQDLFDQKMTFNKSNLFNTVEDLIVDNNELKEIKKSLNVDFKHLKPSFDVTIDADFEKLDLVFDNLFKNAGQHSFEPSEKTKFNILITYLDKEDEIELIFCTDGKPFPNDITDDFFVTKNKSVGHKDNSGFGGYLIGNIMQKHGGSVSIRNRSEELKPQLKNEVVLTTFVTLTFPKVNVNGTEPEQGINDR